MALEWIDTHAHLDDERFHADLQAVLERAAQAGLKRIVVVATTALDSPNCVELAAKHPILRATVGIQPNHVAEVTPTAWDEVVALSTRPEVVALGETGLDRYWDRTPFAQQEDYFARHLELARTLFESDRVQTHLIRRRTSTHGPETHTIHAFPALLFFGEDVGFCLPARLH